MTPKAETAPLASNSSLAKADRQLARSVIGVFVLASIVSVLGPLLSYRSDLAELRGMFRARVVRSASDDADLLNRHLQLLLSELERMAGRPEINLLDNTMRPEKELLDAAHRQSTLFDSGVAIVDLHGRLAWSEPPGLKAVRFGDAWFMHLLSGVTPQVGFVSPARRTFVVGVPVVRDGEVTGALVGFSRPLRSALPESSDAQDFARFVVDAAGHFTPVDSVSGWMASPEFLHALRRLPFMRGPLRLPSGRELFAASDPVGHSGLTLVAVGSEAELTAPIRYRFQLQMLLLISLQFGAVFLLYIYLRRTYLRFLGVERQAVEQERLLALGTASSLIAHEVKNSLNGMQAATTLLSAVQRDRRSEQEEDLHLAVSSIKGEVDRLKHLASSLLHFGRPADVQVQPTDLRALVDEVVEGARVLPESDEVALSVQGPATLSALCDPLLVATAVHNLVRNAVEATVAAKDLGRLRDPHVRVRLSRSGGSTVIDVDDNAGGLAPEVETRLFEPFVTGKPKGIGLGLSMTRRALEAQQGTVTYTRTPLGSQFTIRLPVGREDVVPESHSQPASEVGARG